MNIESLGIGFIYDDAIGAWHGYDPIYVHLDPSRIETDTAIPIGRPNFGETDERPRLLISGGWGIPGVYSTNQEWGAFELQYGIGIGYRHLIEALYRSSIEYNTGFTSSSALQYDGETAMNSFLVRLYPWHQFFVESGVSSIHMSTDSAKEFDDFSQVKSFAPAYYSINAIEAGLGWSGDFSYIEAREEFGLSPYQFFDQPARQFGEFVVTFGLIFIWPNL